ncbi:major facilitator superfamily domain-containing protein [Cercophora newfieldiana]|uniref:Major facilitator superfamily domain-containing protein n=1 Tax=Cercophora newfieldiana TaxID=92897 RepID=A0AA40CRM1_9PEZI|nr:major facilitator superfamily domain-containing protein [Cercophora newfieldiana]
MPKVLFLFLTAPQRRIRMRKIIDHGRLVKRLWFVGASGFLATGYSFFASNVSKPVLYYVYPPCGRLSSNAGMVMDELTLVGAAIGMVGAGVLADLYGRKKLYGFELALLIIATLGLIEASEGFQSQRSDGSSDRTMDIYSWLAWWQFWLGVAIGAEHPLVAIITAEWVRTKSRGRMLAAVFAAQPVARLAAYGVGLAVLKGVSSANGLSPDAADDGEVWKHVADQVWRWVRGFAILPALVAVGFRFTIPESPLYYADIVRDTIRGLKDMADIYRDKKGPKSAAKTTDDESLTAYERYRKWRTNGIATLRTKVAGQNLVRLSLLWVLTDIAWYCLALESPSAMATLWADPSATTATTPSAADSNPLTTNGTSCPEFLSWRSDPTNPSTSVYRELERSATRFMLVVSIGSILGSLALMIVINRVHRRVLLMTTCCALAALFAVSGSVLLGTRASPSPESRIAIDVLFGLMHFLFVLGPRTLVLIMGVELFPTVYRGTFYGLAAAAAKVGAIVIRPIIGKVGKSDMALGIRLMVAVALMVLCVAISYFLPEVQRERRTADVESSSQESDGETAAPSPALPGGNKGMFGKTFSKLETMTLEELEMMALKEI